MPSDAPQPAFDFGLLSPVTVGHDQIVSDAAVVTALVDVEIGLLRLTREARGVDAAEVPPRPDVDARAIARAAVAGGNPVIPLVKTLRTDDAYADVHDGATSQDILDTALMLIASRARAVIADNTRTLSELLVGFAAERRDQVAAARTLTQHAVPTTMGLRASVWLQGVKRAAARLDALVLPVQLGGAGGTLAAFVDRFGVERAAVFPAALARDLRLDAAEAPWHTARWPVTELGDALVQMIDAVGKIAADVATLSRTEIGELFEGEGGGSSAMPQKRNPTASVLIRSAALRAPQLGATLHLAAGFAVDERPDGAWHAEWPTLRELLRLALGATAHARNLVGGLVVDDGAVARNLALTGGLIVSERFPHALPSLSPAQISNIVRRTQGGEDLHRLLAEAGAQADDLLDPSRYTGLADRILDAATDAGEAKAR